MLTYKTYEKLDKLAFEYVSDKYDYCGVFCNNNTLNSLLRGETTKQKIYEKHLDYVTELICKYADFSKVIKENKWYGKLLIKYNYLTEQYLDD